MLGSKNLHVCSMLSWCLDLLCNECIHLKCKNKQPYAVAYPIRHSNHAQYQTFAIKIDVRGHKKESVKKLSSNDTGL